jgi:uncharacterized protein YjbJ (UPF0337 family)
MGALKGTADKAVGTAQETVAEIIGDARLQEEGKFQKRKGKTEKVRSKFLTNVISLKALMAHKVMTTKGK